MSEHTMDVIRLLTDSHRAANARIAELDEAIRQHKAAIEKHKWGPDFTDRALYEVIYQR